MKTFHAIHFYVRLSQRNVAPATLPYLNGVGRSDQQAAITSNLQTFPTRPRGTSKPGVGFRRQKSPHGRALARTRRYLQVEKLGAPIHRDRNHRRTARTARPRSREREVVVGRINMCTAYIAVACGGALQTVANSRAEGRVLNVGNVRLTTASTKVEPVAAKRWNGGGLV